MALGAGLAAGLWQKAKAWDQVVKIGRTHLMDATPIRVGEQHFVNGNRIAPPFPPGTARAMYGMGCFWGAEQIYWQLPGVYTTSVGYAGGYTPYPSYEEVCSAKRVPTARITSASRVT